MGILVMMFLTAAPAVSTPLVPSQHSIHHRPGAADEPFADTRAVR